MNNVNKDHSGDKYAVMLPCEPHQFNQFIGSLLGKPQTITQHLEGSFDVSMPELITLYHLVDQRVSQQNRGTLLQFVCRINYNDGSSVLLNSFEDLQTYNEVRNVTATQIQMSWVFLLLFETKTVPEKQVVDVSFICGGRWKNSYLDTYSVHAPSGIVAIQIQHTARTWGADIQGLLTNHLESIVIKEGFIKTFILKNSGYIMLFMTLLIFFLTFAGIYRASALLAAEQLSSIDKLVGSSIELSSKLDGLLSLIHANAANNFLLASLGYVITAIFVSILSSMWIGFSSEAKKPSFIVLSKADEKLRAKMLNNNQKKWISFGFSIMVSLATGIAGNIIFTRYWTQ